MFGHKILFIAAALYLTVVGCVMWNGSGDRPSATAAEPANNLVKIEGMRPYCGVAIRLQRVDWVEEYKKTIDKAAEEGADTVSFVVDAREDNGKDNAMYLDMRMTMTPPQLAELIGYAKQQKHMRVVLMPMVLVDNPVDNEWRGTLDPTDWHTWFENYRAMMKQYAYIAQDDGVDVLVVGSELVSSEEHYDEWVQTIRDVRDCFHGQLTYSSNWDRYQKVRFWKYLDIIGMNSYWKLGKDSSASVEEIKESWTKKWQPDIFKFASEQHKPVLLLEAGWCSLSNAATDPWDYTQDTLDADNDLQRRLYEGFFQSWWGNPQLAGFMMWEIHPGPDQTGKGYTPVGKPAEAVMKEWMAKPRWDIMTTGTSQPTTDK
jgi:hypothetical protein